MTILATIIKQITWLLSESQLLNKSSSPLQQINVSCRKLAEMATNSNHVIATCCNHQKCEEYDKSQNCIHMTAG